MKQGILAFLVIFAAAAGASAGDNQANLEQVSKHLAEIMYSGDETAIDELLENINPYMDPAKWVFAHQDPASSDWKPGEDITEAADLDRELAFHDWLQACYQMEYGLQRLGGGVWDPVESKMKMAEEATAFLGATDEKSDWLDIARMYLDGGPGGYARWRHRGLLIQALESWSDQQMKVIGVKTVAKHDGFRVIEVTALDRQAAVRVLIFGWDNLFGHWRWELLSPPVETDQTPNLILYGNHGVTRLGDGNVIDISPYIDIVPSEDSEADD